MEQGKIYVTRQRLAEIEEEVRKLKVYGRRDIAARIAEARSHGDLSENAEYDAAREEQGLLELRIRKMEEILGRSTIIDESNISIDKVGIMTRVTVINEKTGKESDYQIVSQEEADFDNGRISMSSPIGKALMGKRVGDGIQVKVPAGVLNFKVKEIGR
ncbi:MAG: transcription elongation factor GreA [Bacteroidota bacterium]|nr:transcription elongation factor GreA [Bacteroidota bacterium]MDP4234398.1 transcription elongation factor GreA [Bacteroidota bacterium]MDP4243331.1 transcription elongation factor GreA [Bacteroidota bacterium]MDP4288016.1 transcription elongation factor GreA [Bacteroidota bacterium]